jgi:hypothetical protein
MSKLPIFSIRLGWVIFNSQKVTFVLHNAPAQRQPREVNPGDPWGTVPSSEKGYKPLTAHSTDQQPFLVIAQQLKGNKPALLAGLLSLCP